jgi:hypothetical protein
MTLDAELARIGLEILKRARPTVLLTRPAVNALDGLREELRGLQPKKPPTDGASPQDEARLFFWHVGERGVGLIPSSTGDAWEPDPRFLADLEHHTKALESAAQPKEKRKRSTKQDTKIRTHAAIMHKAEHPTATEQDCADAAVIPRTTLAQQSEWIEWVPKIEKAAASGRLPDIKKAIDKTTGNIIPTTEDGAS